MTTTPDRPSLVRSARKLAGSTLERVRYGRIPAETDYGSPVAWDAAGNDVVRDRLAAGGPCLVARLGDVELRAITHYLRWREHTPVALPYATGLRRAMRRNTGFFPAETGALDRFSRLMLDATRTVDVMAVWFNRSEDRVVREHCPNADLVELAALNCMCYPRPWSSALEGKRVLVVHPFARSIESQYRDRRREIFADASVLPDFELQTLKPVQSIAGNDCGHATWFDALEDTCERIAEREFDVAVIGAGAYGLPLGAFVKSIGRQAVHMGGATQLLFGIIGRRWEREYADTIMPLVNDAWVRPLPEEIPPRADTVERGAYW